MCHSVFFRCFHKQHGDHLRRVLPGNSPCWMDLQHLGIHLRLAGSLADLLLDNNLPTKSRDVLVHDADVPDCNVLVLYRQ